MADIVEELLDPRCAHSMQRRRRAAAEITRLREALSSARVNYDTECEEHFNTKEALASETAAREKAEREVERLSANGPVDYRYWEGRYRDEAADNADLTRKLEAAAGALEPFAKVSEHDIGLDETDGDRFRQIERHNRAPLLLVGDLRRAREAHAALLGKEKGVMNGGKAKLTTPRREMLEDLLDGAKSGNLSYAPNKWALANGFITARDGRYGSTILEITDAGRAALSSEPGALKKGDGL